MEKKDMTILGVSIAAVLALAVLASFTLRIFASNAPDLVLPPESVADVGGEELDDPFEGSVLRVEVTVDTVQEVIATLSRPASYFRELQLESFWPDDSQERGWAGAVTQAQVWVEGGDTRVDLTTPGGRTFHRIVTGDKLYLWYDDERSYAVLPADDRSADLEQRIPTYEDVLALPEQSITAAGYEQKEGVSCVFVEVDASAMGYRERFWVSVDNGLLVAAETWSGDDLIYRMNGLRVTIPGEGSGFLLPDGSSARSEGSQPQ